MDSKMKRRDFLKISALASVAVVAAACAPTATPTAAPTVASNATAAATTAPKATAAATTAATAVPKATEVPKATAVPTKAVFQGEIEFYAQSLTPTRVLLNPDPKAPKRQAFDTVANAWMDLHPGVKLTFINAPTDTYDTWLTTALIGGVGPDIYWYYLGTLHAMADLGQAMPINDYLELPNKYTPGDKTAWKMSFLDPFLTSASPKGNFGGVPTNLVTTGIFYNKEAFSKIGVDVDKAIVPELGSPKDWATMMEWCKSLKEAGYIAMSPGEGGKDTQGAWTMRSFAQLFLWNWVPSFDILNYHNDTPLNYQKNIISHEELHCQHWCFGWYPSKDPAYMEMFRVMKDWSQYWQEGFAQTDNGMPYDLFATGKLAMFWGGSWRVGDMLQDDRRTFDIGSFWLPPITKATSSFAKDPPVLPVGVGGFGAAYGINPKCLKKGNMDDCVDWLMYMTTPANDELVTNEVPSYVPAVHNAKGLPEIQNLFVGLQYLTPGGNMPICMTEWTFGNRWYDDTQRLIQLFLVGDQTQEQLGTTLDASVDANAANELRADAIQYTKEGSWDLTQWPCQPKV